MNLHRRKCAFTPSRFHLLIEVDGKLGYEIDGEFIPIWDAPKKTAEKKLSPTERLKKFLDESVRMRELVDAGAVVLSVDSQGNIYCHSQPDFFKFHSAIGKTIEGAERDGWAQAQFEKNERVIVEIKQSGVRLAPKDKLLTIPPMKKTKPVDWGRDMVEELVYP